MAAAAQNAKNERLKSKSRNGHFMLPRNRVSDASIHGEEPASAETWLSKIYWASMKYLKPITTVVHTEKPTLPLTIDLKKEEEKMGELFLQAKALKTCESLGKATNNVAQWIQFNMVLCRDRLMCHYPDLHRNGADNIVLEDIPLVLIETIQFGELENYRDRRWRVHASEEQPFSDPRWQRLLGIRTQGSNENIQPFKVQPIPRKSKRASLASRSSLQRAMKSFLRLSIECSDLGESSKIDPVCILCESNNNSWHFIGQTECVPNNQNPAFQTKIDIDYPTDSRVFRFSLIDTDHSDVCINFKTRDNGGPGMLGFIDVPASELVKGIGETLRFGLQLKASQSDSIKKCASKISILVEEIPESDIPCVLLFQTKSDDLYISKRHALVFNSERVRYHWATNMRRAIWQARRDKAMEHGRFFSMQEAFRDFYSHDLVQAASGMLVVANFIGDASRAEMRDVDQSKFDVLDVMFTTLFALELAINMYGTWFKSFFGNGWNLFDLFTVIVSILSLLKAFDLGVIRLFRAFRVMRLIKRVASLRLILNALIASLAPVSGALFILFLIMAVFAIIASNTWGYKEPKLDKFSSSLFTMFVISTGDGWSDFARSLFDDPTELSWGVVIFFVVYIIAASWILFNIVLAVMLEAFSESCTAEKISINASKKVKELSSLSTNQLLAPLINELTFFGSKEQLNEGMENLWNNIDEDLDGMISFTEFCLELRGHNIAMSLENWQVLVEEARRMVGLGGASDESTEPISFKDYEMDKLQFKAVLKHNIQIYYQQGLVHAAENCTEADLSTKSVVNALKMVLLNQGTGEIPTSDLPNAEVFESHLQESKDKTTPAVRNSDYLNSMVPVHSISGLDVAAGVISATEFEKLHIELKAAQIRIKILEQERSQIVDKDIRCQMLEQDVSLFKSKLAEQERRIQSLMEQLHQKEADSMDSLFVSHVEDLQDIQERHVGKS